MRWTFFSVVQSKFAIETLPVMQTVKGRGQNHFCRTKCQRRYRNPSFLVEREEIEILSVTQKDKWSKSFLSHRKSREEVAMAILNIERIVFGLLLVVSLCRRSARRPRPARSDFSLETTRPKRDSGTMAA